jgi:type III pantothenate kinase
VLDVGNSKTLGVLFCKDEERFRWRVDYADGNPNWSRQSRHALAAARALGGDDVAVRVASVAPRRAAVVERQVRRLGWRRVRRLTHRDTWPMRLGVLRPEALGVDRMANIAGLVALGIRRGVVVDAGTAITVDVLRSATHAGGLILPGRRLWAAALHAHTAQLPRVGWRVDAAMLGRDTRGALQAGLRHGLVGALRSIVESLRADLGRRCAVVFTGGDGMDLHAACALSGSRLEPDLLVLGVRSVAGGGR